MTHKQSFFFSHYHAAKNHGQKLAEAKARHEAMEREEAEAQHKVEQEEDKKKEHEECKKHDKEAAKANKIVQDKHVLEEAKKQVAQCKAEEKVKVEAGVRESEDELEMGSESGVWGARVSDL